MKDEILHNEKSYTDEDSNEFYTGAIVPADLAIFPVDAIDATLFFSEGRIISNLF